MIEILKKAKVPIIIIIVLVLVFVIYSKFFKTEDPVDGLARTSDSENYGRKSPSQDFIPLLNLIKSVDFDDRFFSDPVFESMVDFSEPIKQEDKGRANPFSAGIISSENNIAGSGIVFEASDTNTASTTLSNPPLGTSSTTSQTGGGQQ